VARYKSSVARSAKGEQRACADKEYNPKRQAHWCSDALDDSRNPSSTRLERCIYRSEYQQKSSTPLAFRSEWRRHGDIDADGEGVLSHKL